MPHPYHAPAPSRPVRALGQSRPVVNRARILAALLGLAAACGCRDGASVPADGGIVFRGPPCMVKCQRPYELCKARTPECEALDRLSRSS